MNINDLLPLAPWEGPPIPRILARPRFGRIGVPERVIEVPKPIPAPPIERPKKPAPEPEKVPVEPEKVPVRVR